MVQPATVVEPAAKAEPVKKSKPKPKPAAAPAAKVAPADSVSACILVVVSPTSDAGTEEDAADCWRGWTCPRRVSHRATAHWYGNISWRLANKRLGEGMSSYMAYKVVTKTTMPSFPQQELEVLRRYSDFLNMYKMVSELELVV